MKKHNNVNKEHGNKERRLKLITKRFRGWTFCLLFVAVLLVSCASAPRVSFPDELENEARELSILPAGARLYLWVDAVQGRPLLDAIASLYVSGDGVAEILDTTRSAAVAFFPAAPGANADNPSVLSDYPGQNQQRRFFLAASGSFPRARANMAFTFNRDWSRQRSVTGNSYWFSESENIALALGSSLALVSNIDPYEDFVLEVPPPGFAEFNRGYALSGWVNEPAPPINTFISSMGIPLQVPAEEFFFGAASIPIAEGGDWELVFRIGTASPAQAQALLALFSISRFFVMQMPQPLHTQDPSYISPAEAAMLLFANSPEVDGDALTLRVGPIDESRIALLFAMFSVNSN